MKEVKLKQASLRKKSKTNLNDKDVKPSARHIATSYTLTQHCSLYLCIESDLINTDWAHLWALFLHIESSRETDRVSICSNCVQILCSSKQKRATHSACLNMLQCRANELHKMHYQLSDYSRLSASSIR